MYPKNCNLSANCGSQITHPCVKYLYSLNLKKYFKFSVRFLLYLRGDNSSVSNYEINKLFKVEWGCEFRNKYCTNGYMISKPEPELAAVGPSMGDSSLNTHRNTTSFS